MIRLLVVDDKPYFRDLIGRFIENKTINGEPLEMVFITSAHYAIQEINDTLPDLLLTDRHIPERNEGFDVVLAALKAGMDKENIFMMSGKFIDKADGLRVVKERIEDGIGGTLPKPFTREQLFDLLGVDK